VTRLGAGWRVSATRLTEQFGVADYREQHPASIPYCVVNSKGGVDLFAGDVSRKPRPGETVVALLPPDLPPPRGPDAGDESPAT